MAASVPELQQPLGDPHFKAAIYLKNKLYMTLDMAYLSMTEGWKGFERHKERFANRYEKLGYVLDELDRVRPGPECRTVDFGELTSILLSDDPGLLEKNKWIFEDLSDAKFLDVKAEKTVENTGNMVSYSSYPRMGNSFLRKYLQNITGIATGSDMNLMFNVDLQMADFKGEEITDASVWIKKSHDPKWNKGNKRHKAHKVVCCVRNPYDVAVSIMHFFPSLNQGGQIEQDFQKDIPQVWDKLLRETALGIQRYHTRLIE